jgi:prevent-host-death family protein
MRKYKINPMVGLKELRENAEVYIREVEKGRSFLVLRRSKPIFKITPVDEWGDEGNWESVLDFTKIRKGGVPVEEVLKILDKIKKDEARGKISKKPRS